MAVKCSKCSMKEECICIPSSDECFIRKQSYNTAINDFAEKANKEIHMCFSDDLGIQKHIDRIAEQLKAGAIE